MRMRTHTHTHTHTYTHTHTHTHAHTHTRARACIHSHAHVGKICADLHACTWSRTRTNIQMHTQMHTLTNTHTHTQTDHAHSTVVQYVSYTHTQTCLAVQPYGMLTTCLADCLLDCGLNNACDPAAQWSFLDLKYSSSLKVTAAVSLPV